MTGGTDVCVGRWRRGGRQPVPLPRSHLGDAFLAFSGTCVRRAALSWLRGTGLVRFLTEK